MYKYLDGYIKIMRTIIFLCGPYYDKNNVSDRRKILLDFFDANFNNDIISLIIDDFLIDENINDPSINIKLLEEIFAAVSPMTYLFLDTMSAASELGLFANHSTNNKIHVFLPYESDILQKNVGYFVKNIVIGQNTDRIKLDYYRPQIIKIAKATDFAIEHYGFINNKVPLEIADKLLKEPALQETKSEIIVEQSTDFPTKIGEINYHLDNCFLRISISVVTLFYLVADNVYEIFKDDILKNKKIEKVNKDVIRKICTEVKNILIHSIEVKTGENCSFDHIEIKTIIDMNLEEIIKHILKFIIIYHENKPRSGHYFILSTDSFVKKSLTNGKNIPVSFFGMTNSDYQLIKSIVANPNDYFEKFKFRDYNKIREICRYRDNDNGNQAKEIHKKIVSRIEQVIKYSSSSYAYQQGKSIVDCVKLHKESKCFIKFDIRKFFNSINIKKLGKLLIEECNLNEVFDNQVKEIIGACTYEKEVVLGFCISPIFSELYMREVDEMMSEYLIDDELIYTRYADDIVISSNSIIENQKIDEIRGFLEGILNKRFLKINEKKFKVNKIEKVGQHFKYLGINIVKKNGGNELTVGKKYKYNIAKRYLKYLSIPCESDMNIKKKFYESKRIAGQISFVKQVEGMNGYWQIIERIKQSTDARVDIKTENIHFIEEEIQFDDSEIAYTIEE